MAVQKLSTKSIVISFSTPPSLDDVQALSESIIDNLPKELEEYVDDLAVVVDDFPEPALMTTLELDDEFELLSHYTGGEQNGVMHKKGNEERILSIFRRPLLDAWCESEDDLTELLKHIIITEICQCHNLPENRIDDFVKATTL